MILIFTSFSWVGSLMKNGPESSERLFFPSCAMFRGGVLLIAQTKMIIPVSRYYRLVIAQGKAGTGTGHIKED